MSTVGGSADNSLAESFNPACKRETLQGPRAWADEREARLDLFHRLHGYNTRRRHSDLGHRSPVDHERALDRPSTTLASAAYAVPKIRVKSHVHPEAGWPRPAAEACSGCR